MKKQPIKAAGFFLILLIGVITTGFGQRLLDKKISVDINRQRLDQALEIISNQAGFYFSYNSNLLKKDSLVSLSARNTSVNEVLGRLFGNEFEFRESGNYIILRRAPLRLKLVTSSAQTEDKFYTVSGFVIDDQTGQRISDASVYEKDRLSVVNTNANGFFRLRLKSKYKKASITVSKEYYEDTTVSIEPQRNQTLSITLVPLDISESTVVIGPAGIEAPETIDLEIPINDSISKIFRYEKKDSFTIERTALGKWFVSSKQRLQSINLKKFFVARPYQVSVVPGLSTNGKLNSQVINNFSLNIFGGYSGGTNGFELAGLFNIDKKNAQYTQIAGIANLVGGNVSGLQIGGVSNTVLDTVRGVQIGGVANYSGSTVSGMQLAGVSNYSGSTMRGVQIAGVANMNIKEVNGAQIAGVFNYTKHLKGVQIGLINVSDTSEGYSIGLINIVFRGYHKLSLYTNELINMNVAVKSGTRKLYSIFIGGFNSVPDQKVWSFGYGLGSEIVPGKRLSLNAELSSQHLYLGSWDFYNLQNKANLQLNFKIGKYLALFAGPSYTVYVSNQDVHFPGYKQSIPPGGYKTNKLGDKVTGWYGWTAGINLF
ncbi:MAG: carboxypeptidase-like regulatory domain-containing protein [Chitinophagaceae bacterium]|nr:carboxypeptidase-like regulatory domain-containing protein [Chitinophagaceae bacterium]